ncbi:MAG: TRAP transporter large permease subunit [Deltaproteobacteria bacterium]|nr:TRAP transporter large permease subunit [Deltaproteobacteria bacterium]
MEWWVIFICIFFGLILLFAIGVPVAFSFLFVNIVGVYLFWGGTAGLSQLILSILNSVTSFSLLPVPLFVLMGEIMFHSGIAPRMMDGIDKWLGRIPGRLSLLAVGGGTLFATLTGSAMAGVAMLGSVLVPEMERRGYKTPMTLGPILGSGGLAIMIPPSALGVLLASLALFSVGKFLIAIIIPGIIMAVLYAAYILGRCWFQPHLAPSYDLEKVSLYEKVITTIKYVLPLGSIIFLVVGLIFLGVATPTESATLGAMGCFVLAFLYRGLSREIVKKSFSGTLQVTVMMFMILTGSTAFSQILAFTGASQGLIEFAVGLPLSPIFIIVAMQIVLLLLGTFMEPLTILMVTIPIFMPIVNKLGFDPIWFGTVMLLNMEMATTSPPFGLALFVMKGVAPKETRMKEIYLSAIPFLTCDVIAMGIMMAFPQVVLWLPGLMK